MAIKQARFVHSLQGIRGLNQGGVKAGEGDVLELRWNPTSTPGLPSGLIIRTKFGTIVVPPSNIREVYVDDVTSR